MRSREIPHAQWATFLNELADEHRGEMVDVKFTGADPTDPCETRGVRLLNISDDLNDREGERIQIMARDARDSHLTRGIVHPIHVRMAETDQGAPAAIRIESEDGSATLVRFHTNTPEDLPREFVGG